ncbi:MAG: hypothetical protein Q8L88_09215 [Bacteroidota bacterium]|nr:hypothetical protein [Bacteroidota bacterium]
MTSPYKNLPNNILKTVAYFDVFDYPLTTEQIFRFLPQNSISHGDVENAVEHMVKSKELVKEKSYFLLPSTHRNITEKREAEERRAKKRLKYARNISRFIKSLPFIRAVFITGSLSKNVAASSSDIDFMIVAAPERLWVCRTMLTAFRKIFLFGSSKYFCTNFYVTENGYAQQRRNIFTAIEVATTKVIWNESAFLEFQRQNQWMKEFLPNINVSTDQKLMISSSRSLSQQIIEIILSILPLRALNIRLMEFHRTYWQRSFNHTSTEQFNMMFIISPDISAGWPDDRQETILKEFHHRLSSLGIRESL